MSISNACCTFVCVCWLLLNSYLQKSVRYDLSNESLQRTLKAFQSLLFNFTRGHLRILRVSLCEYLLFCLFFGRNLHLRHASTQQETTLSLKSGYKPASQNRPYFILCWTDVIISQALLSSRDEPSMMESLLVLS